MDRRKIDTVIFDVNSIVIDSHVIVKPDWQEIAKEYNVSLRQELLPSMLGSDITDTVNKLFSELAAPIRQEIASNVAARDKKVTYNLVTGFKTLYSQLQEYGVRIGLANRSRSIDLRALFEQHDLDGFITLTSSQSEPADALAIDCYSRAIEFWQAKPKATLVFDSSDAGIRSALALGLQCVAIHNSNFTHVGSITNFDSIKLRDKKFLISYENAATVKRLRKYSLKPLVKNPLFC